MQPCLHAMNSLTSIMIPTLSWSRLWGKCLAQVFEEMAGQAYRSSEGDLYNNLLFVQVAVDKSPNIFLKNAVGSLTSNR